MPGPAEYAASPIDAYKRRAPAPSLGARRTVSKANLKEQAPGPGAYSLGSAMGQKTKGVSMGVRHSDYTMPVLGYIPP